MKEVILQHVLESGGVLKATFLPENGMNLASLKLGSYEIIDQSTLPLFEERSSGLGPLIGPHFYHRKEEDIPHIPDESLFPHIARVKKTGSKEPFSHGIARYIPWNYFASDTSIEGHISGMDAYKGITLAALEGFDFDMSFKAHLLSNGLEIDMHVESIKKPSIVGLHYYLALDQGKGVVKIESEDHYNDMGTWKPIPQKWKDPQNNLYFDLEQESDYGFRPRSKDYTGKALLEMPSYSVSVQYKANSDEHAFQLYHPQNASFVCIEPVSAKNPRAPHLMNHSLKIRIEILCDHLDTR